MDRRVMFVKRSVWAALTFVLVMAFASLALAAEKDIDEFLSTRMKNVYVEGMALDDLVIGARAKLSFLYVDRKTDMAAQYISSQLDGPMSPEIARRIADYTGRYEAKKGMAYFTVGVETFKGWSFDTAEITIAGWHPSKDDILTGLFGTPSAEIRPGTNEIAPDYVGMFAVYVPKDRVKPGAEIEIGYGEHTARWTVPKE